MKGRVFRSYVSARAVGERVHTKGRKKDTLELPFVQERTYIAALKRQSDPTRRCSDN